MTSQSYSKLASLSLSLSLSESQLTASLLFEGGGHRESQNFPAGALYRCLINERYWVIVGPMYYQFYQSSHENAVMMCLVAFFCITFIA